MNNDLPLSKDTIPHAWVRSLTLNSAIQKTIQKAHIKEERSRHEVQGTPNLQNTLMMAPTPLPLLLLLSSSPTSSLPDPLAVSMTLAVR